MNEREVFTEALARPDPVERATFLDAACRGDDTLRGRVEALLARHAEADSPLDRRHSDLLADLAAPNSAEITIDRLTDAAGQLAVLLTRSDRPGALGRVGHYDVLEILGQGGFGIVVRAFDNSLQRVVAIKFLAPALAATSPPRQRFLREARAAARVTHDHVVRVHAVEEQPVPYLVMEYVEGRTLQDIHDGTGPLSPTEVVRIGRQVALGLAAAHEQGLIHRDVKPANVLIDAGAEGRARLTDFGLARAADDACMTQSGAVAGTPMYMAPEQARGEVLDTRADLFSLGSVLYTITAGRPPFRAANAFAVLKRVAEDRPRPLSEVMPGTPPGLIAVIDKLLAKQPEDRFATAREAADALAGCLTDSAPSLPTTAPLRKISLAVGAVVLMIAVAGWFLGSFLRPSTDPAPVTEGMVQQPPSAAPSLTWEDKFALLPAEEQTAAVLARLKELNPKFQDANSWGRVEMAQVVELRIMNCDHLNDLTPVRFLAGLKQLHLNGRGPADLAPLRGLQLEYLSTNRMPIKDLSPLAGMPLKTCKLWQFETADLSPLAGMHLEWANVGGSPVTNLSVFQPMRLTNLCLSYTKVHDLSPLEGHPLVTLECENTKVTDLRPIADAPLEVLRIKGSPIADYSLLRQLPLKELDLDYQPRLHAELLQAIPTLETINKVPARKFLSDPQNAVPAVPAVN